MIKSRLLTCVNDFSFIHHLSKYVFSFSICPVFNLFSFQFLFLLQTQGLYLVKWSGWSAESNTWEPLAHLQDCCEKLKEFYTQRLAEREGAPSAKKRFLEVPADPRTNFERRSELADTICPPPCHSELEAFNARFGQFSILSKFSTLSNFSVLSNFH